MELTWLDWVKFSFVVSVPWLIATVFICRWITNRAVEAERNEQRLRRAEREWVRLKRMSTEELVDEMCR